MSKFPPSTVSSNYVPSRNEQLVLDELRSEKAPLTAYALLDRLRGEGLKAPPQIYRALEKLTATQRVHRIESLNAFVACCSGHCTSNALAAFTICVDCGDVEEMDDPAIFDRLEKSAGRTYFKTQRATVELHGQCSACSGTP